MMDREIRFEFVFQHQDSKEIKTKRFTLDEIANGFEDELFILECDCEPVGETNVVECNCEDYLEDFRLIDKRQYIGRKDKNGLDIYEGYIIKCGMNFEGGSLPHIGEVVYDNTFAAFATKNSSGITLMHNHLLNTLEIVGTIDKNPELLEP
jgi:uncharacterized phage protein (TIGR01671 family)